MECIYKNFRKFRLPEHKKYKKWFNSVYKHSKMIIKLQRHLTLGQMVFKNCIQKIIKLVRQNYALLNFLV